MVSPQIAAGNPADAPEASPGGEMPARLNGAPNPALARSWGPSMRRRSPWLRSLPRGRRPHVSHHGANPAQPAPLKSAQATLARPVLGLFWLVLRFGRCPHDHPPPTVPNRRPGLRSWSCAHAGRIFAPAVPRQVPAGARYCGTRCRTRAKDDRRLALERASRPSIPDATGP
jgi:hypothetical protein